MLRKEIALFLILSFLAYIYFSAEKEHTLLHRTFSALLTVTLLNLAADCVTVYTVNHLETVPKLLNDIVHRLFIGTMILIFFLFYKYIAILVEEETGKPRRLDLFAGIFLIFAELADLFLPIHYAVTSKGNYIGVNFIAYLTNIRMEKARKLLLSTSLSIAEVSEQSGYSDYRVFTKVFKKSEGITPSQYRRNFLEKTR